MRKKQQPKKKSHKNSKMYTATAIATTHRKTERKKNYVYADSVTLFSVDAVWGGKKLNEQEKTKKKNVFGTLGKKRNSIESTNTSSTSFLVAVIQT